MANQFLPQQTSSVAVRLPRRDLQLRPVTDAAPQGRELTLTARLTTARLDARRGVVRLHREVLAALGLVPWDAVRLTGRRTTGAVAAVSGPEPRAATCSATTCCSATSACATATR